MRTRRKAGRPKATRDRASSSTAAAPMLVDLTISSWYDMVSETS